MARRVLSLRGHHPFVLTQDRDEPLSILNAEVVDDVAPVNPTRPVVGPSRVHRPLASLERISPSCVRILPLGEPSEAGRFSRFVKRLPDTSLPLRPCARLSVCQPWMSRRSSPSRNDLSRHELGDAESAYESAQRTSYAPRHSYAPWRHPAHVGEARTDARRLHPSVQSVQTGAVSQHIDPNRTLPTLTRAL
jgi:hypothetical protein